MTQGGMHRGKFIVDSRIVPEFKALSTKHLSQGSRLVEKETYVGNEKYALTSGLLSLSALRESSINKITRVR